MRRNPIGRILGNLPVGLTTPTVNGTQLPDDFMRAGELLFQALRPRSTNFDASTKQCSVNDFDVKVSANVIVPTQPEGDRWTMSLPGASIQGIPACRDRKTVPVVMRGKPDSEAAGKWIEKNEEEHVTDLRGLYQKHLKRHFDWLLGLKLKSDDANKCPDTLAKALGDKDAIVVRDFLKEWGEAIQKRDEGGKHTLSNKINTQDNCTGIEIESTKK
jgi:hypothetical protein